MMDIDAKGHPSPIEQYLDHLRVCQGNAQAPLLYCGCLCCLLVAYWRLDRATPRPAAGLGGHFGDLVGAWREKSTTVHPIISGAV